MRGERWADVYVDGRFVRATQTYSTDDAWSIPFVDERGFDVCVEGDGAAPAEVHLARSRGGPLPGRFGSLMTPARASLAHHPIDEISRSRANRTS